MSETYKSDEADVEKSPGISRLVKQEEGMEKYPSRTAEPAGNPGDPASRCHSNRLMKGFRPPERWLHHS